jgi:hypothetical protein
LGWLLVVSGAVMVFQPKWTRQKMTGQGFRMVKGFLLTLILFLGFNICSAFIHSSGLGLKLGLLTGMILLIKVYLVFKKKLWDKVNQWVSKLPDKWLKIYAFCQIILGFIMLTWQKRILF